MASQFITYEDSLRLPEDKCEEIVKGELRKLPPPSLRHARFVERLALLLRTRLPHDRFEVLVSAFGQGIRKEPFTYRVPDLGVYLRSQLTDDHYIWAVPELLVEVGPPGDLIEDYDFLKAPEVWFIDLDARSVLRLTRENKELVCEGSISPARLSGVTLELSELF